MIILRKKKAGKNALRLVLRSNLPLLWGDDYNFVSEIFIPFSDTGDDNDRYALGDIEFWPIKYAFLTDPERIVTGALSIGLPTGDKKYGFGEGQTKLAALLFID